MKKIELNGVTSIELSDGVTIEVMPHPPEVIDVCPAVLARMERRLGAGPLKGKKLDAAIDAAFKIEADRVIIPMLAIPKIYQAGRVANLAGEDIQEAIAAAVEKYRARE